MRFLSVKLLKGNTKIPIMNAKFIENTERQSETKKSEAAEAAATTVTCQEYYV